MGEVFWGWKRKAGCVTLVMALFLLVGWVRSSTTVDLITLPGMSTNYILVSGGQAWQIIYARSFEMTTGTWWDGDGNVAHGVKLDLINEFHRCGLLWFSESASSIDIYQREEDENSEVQMILAPYWIIVIPLTLISCWLLLSNPRQRMVESVPEKAA